MCSHPCQNSKECSGKHTAGSLELLYDDMLADVRDVMEWIGRDCHMLNESRRKDQGRRVEDGWQGNSHHDCRPIRVVDETVTLNLCSSQQEETDALRGLVERVAYGIHEGYRFPSVRRNDVPKTHALAVATLEAVHRGVDVA